jgi:hypothetical protein
VVLAYAEALATREASATVEIPVRLSDGSSGRASILIGPASQLISQSAPDGGDEIVDEDLIEQLVTRTRALGVSRPLTEDTDAAHGDQLEDLDILTYDPSNGHGA